MQQDLKCPICKNNTKIFLEGNENYYECEECKRVFPKIEIKYNGEIIMKLDQIYVKEYNSKKNEWIEFNKSGENFAYRYNDKKGKFEKKDKNNKVKEKEIKEIKFEQILFEIMS